MPLPAGAQLGSFEIVQPLGAGGMGEVYLARDRELNRSVAVKVLPPDVTSAPHRVARFEQEARAASALNHPNVCVIHTLGRTDDGRRFIAMEYVEGETLRMRLVRGRLPLREALDIGIQIAAGLTAAHAAGIVHRDLKPENVMVRRDRLVKVLDFGLAKLAPAAVALATDEPTASRGMTEPGSVAGTTRYMAPEQARGEEVDARADVWALGVVLYELVTGRPPFTGATRSDVLAAILEREPAKLTEFDASVPHELQRIVGKALRKDPDERCQVMKDLLLDLRALRTEFDESSASGPPVAHLALALRSRQRALIAAVGAVFIAALASSGAWWWTRAPDAPGGSAGAMMANRPLTRLTFGPGLQTDPTFSPDGRFIAYASDREGQFDIWVQPMDGRDPVQVTRSSAHDTQPDWSPDGASIVYHSSHGGGGIYLVPALGGPERQLTSFGIRPRWSHDGSEILIQAGNMVGEAAGLLEIHAVSPDTGETRALRSDFLSEGRWYWLGEHPDGRVSALGHHSGLGFGFFTLDRVGGPPVSSDLPEDFPLRHDATRTSPARFQWSGSGTDVCFELVSGGVQNLWKAVVDPSTLAVVSMERLTTGPGRDTASAWTRDGRRLAYTALNESVQLWMYPFDAAAGRLTGDGQPVTPEGATVLTSDLSRDGRRLVYALQRSGLDRTELWMLDVDTERRTLIARDLGGPIAGALSPDGRSLAYLLQRHEPHRAALMLRSLDDDRERALSRWSADSVFTPSGWTPDGRAILGSLFRPFPGRARLGLWPIAAGEQEENPESILISEDRVNIWEARVSPDGRWLSFVAERQATPGRLEMAVAPLRDSSVGPWTRLAADHDWPDKPRWAPDGRTLYFISRRPDAYFNLWGVRFDPDAGRPAGEPFALTSISSPSLVISPRVGRSSMLLSANRVVLTMQRSAGNIWMLEGVDK